MTLEQTVFTRVRLRLIPFMFLLYLVNYLDRVNIGFAALQMNKDLGFGPEVYGFGAGIFFWGYLLFEIPSNLLMDRVGARKWIARIMITWGIVSALFMFIKTPLSFYALRFVLGVAEAGFFPGIILYLTYWFPSDRRGRMISMFMMAIPISGIFGGPLSGWIMATFAGAAGLAGWQWLFLLEAAPALIVGVIVLMYLDNGIRSATWLNEEEKTLLERKLAEDSAHIELHPSLRAVLADPRVALMCGIYFCIVMGQYGLTFWMPTLIQGAGVAGTLKIGLFTAIPYGAGAVAMIFFGRSADRRRERRWHAAGAMLIGAAGMTLSAIAGTHTAVAIGFLTIASTGVFSCAPLFWSLPTAFLSGAAAAAGIAAINSIGNLAGFVSPYVVGWLKDLTHSTQAGMYAVSGVLVAGAVIILVFVPARLVNR